MRQRVSPLLLVIGMLALAPACAGGNAPVDGGNATVDGSAKSSPTYLIAVSLGSGWAAKTMPTESGLVATITGKRDSTPFISTRSVSYPEP